MCMYFKTETDTLQNLIDDFLTLIVREDQRPAFFFLSVVMEIYPFATLCWVNNDKDT